MAAAALLAAGLVTFVPAAASAYVGPGAGFAFVTSFFLLLGTALLVLLALLTWPFRLLWRLLRRRRPPNPPRIRRMVIVGLDGLDPNKLRQLLEQGRLPNVQRVAELGGLGELGTTCPPISPVAWSTFATGVDPSRHGIFDFLAPSRTSYRARLSSSEILPPRRQLRLGPIALPLSKPRLRSLRRAIPFWKLLGRAGVRSCVLRVPITFPPDRFEGTMLSAMCTPDLLGTQGSYTCFCSESRTDQQRDSRVVRVQPEGDRVRTELEGPPHPLRRDGRPLRLPLELTLDRQQRRARLQVSGQKLTLELGRHSDWVTLTFSALPGLKLQGLCRFCLGSLDPLRLYATPIQIDPSRPTMPIAHPFVFSVFLGKLIGRFATVGLAEDTTALNEGVLDEAAFLEQVQLYHAERERMFFEMLRRTRRGVLTCVFDATDRVQHMFMRQGQHPGDAHAGAIDEIYVQMDRMLGRLLAQVDFVDPRNQLLVLSDHGFAPFERGVHLNTWLQQEGYLALEPGRERPGPYLEGVDWERTRAYALGLAGLYLNQRGREARGVVATAEAASLCQELRTKLEALDDPQGGSPIRNVFVTRELYSGPFLDDAPDLIVGYARGYRASWETAQGTGGAAVVEENPRHWSGDHCIDPELVPGVLLSSRPLRLEGAKMADIAPTVLELFGIPKPEHMTGRSLVEGGAR